MVKRLPEDFELRTREVMGEQLYAKFIDGLREDAPVSIRLNRTKCGGRTSVADEDGRVPWCADGYYLGRRPNFTFDPLLHAGLYYVQEAASMFVSHAVRQWCGETDRPSLVLDMCAAPGGKSTAALAALPPGTVLVSNEPVRTRAQVLAENLHKWGNPNTIVTNNYPDDFDGLSLGADLLICDVPCSGEGMFRKEEGAVGEWALSHVMQCAALQRDIVRKAWRQLRPGGVMIYSTCTYNREEDEDNVAWICRELDATLLPVDVMPEWGVTGSLSETLDGPVYRFVPGVTRGEGLFVAVLRKPGGEAEDVPARTKDAGADRKRRGKAAAKEGQGGCPCASWLSTDEKCSFLSDGGNWYALSETLRTVYDQLAGRLRILKAGVTLGQVKGRDVVPSQSLALSTVLSKDAFPQAELDYREAIAYLRKEAVTMPPGVPRGFVVVTYRGVPLGFVKNIGQRANNLYPQEWRIKSTHVPEEETIINDIL